MNNRIYICKILMLIKKINAKNLPHDFLNLFHHLNHRYQCSIHHAHYLIAIIVYRLELFHYLINVLNHQLVYLSMQFFCIVPILCVHQKLKIENKRKEIVIILSLSMVIYIYIEDCVLFRAMYT